MPASFLELAERLIDGAAQTSGPRVEQGAFAWPLGEQGYLFALLERDELPDYDRVVIEVLVGELAALLEEVGDGQLGTDEGHAFDDQLSQRLLTAAFDALPSGTVLIYDHDLRYRLAAGTDLERHGLSPLRMVGRTIEDVLGAEVAGALEPNYRAALAGEVRVWEFPYGDDQFLVRAAPIRETDGSVIGGVITTQNITATVRAKEQLARAQALLLSARRLTGGLLWRLNVDSGDIEWGPAADETLGFDGQAGAPSFGEWLDRVHPDDIAEFQLVLGNARAGRAGEVEARFHGFDGRWRRFRCKLVSAGGSSVVDGICSELPDP